MPARLDKPLRLMGAVKTAKAQLGGELSLQSLLKMSHDSTRSTRSRETMLVKTMGMF
jgi:hypothetical protein